MEQDASVDNDSILSAQLEAEVQQLRDDLTAIKAASKRIQEKDLGYATFKGRWPNDVDGRMVFKSPHVIDSHDPKGRMAEAGDYVIGEWSDGHLVQGIWYGADNQVKGSIIIGKK